MVSLMELLPLMVDRYGKPMGWKDSQDSKAVTLEPGNTEHIGPFKQPGWLRSLVLVTNNRYSRLEHTIWEKAMLYVPYTMFLHGNITPGAAGIPWLQTYNVQEENYKIEWQPQPPQEFLKDTDIWITGADTNLVTEAPITTDTDITLTWHVILIFNRSRFLEALKEVFGNV